MTPVAALKGAVWWLETLCEACDVDAETTTVNVSGVAKGDTDRKELAVMNLAASLAEYKAAIIEAGETPIPSVETEDNGGEWIRDEIEI